MMFGLLIGFTERLQIVTTSNYSAIVNSHALQFTTARAKSSQSTVSSPVDAPLLPGSRPRRLTAILHQPPTVLTTVSRLKTLLQAKFKVTLAPSPLRFTTREFFQINPCRHSPYVTFSLARRWVSFLRIFLTFSQVCPAIGAD
jgi:hypothetical protein